MDKQNLLYSGKAKKLYQTEQENVLHVEYLDQATALNGLKKDQIVGKGELNNQITSFIFNYLKEQGVLSHFISQLSKTEQLVKKVQIIPLEVVLRNLATGSFVKKFHVEEGKVLTPPIMEFFYKNDELNDPMMNEDHIHALQLATPEEIQEIKKQTRLINELLKELFSQIGLTLVDFKLEFGRDLETGAILLADEISPDTCRLWDQTTGKSFDKDVYRKDIGNLIDVYQIVFDRLMKLN